MARLISRIRGSGFDGENRFNSPSTNLWAAGGTALRIGTAGGFTYRTFLQFRPDLVKESTCSAAILRFKAAGGGYSSTLGTITARLLNRFGAQIDATVISDTVLATATSPGTVWLDNETVEVDVTTLVAAALAHASYTAGGYVTLSLESDEAALRTIHAVEADFLEAAALVVDFQSPAPEELTPYELVTRGLWWMLEASPEFCRLVSPASRVTYVVANDRLPGQDERMAADYPEVRIVQSGGQVQYHASSNSSMEAVTFSVEIGTGDQQVNLLLHPLRLAIVRAFANWTDVLFALRWRGNRFVNRLEPLAMTEGLALNRQTNQIVGWANAWQCRIHMVYPTAHLQGS